MLFLFSQLLLSLTTNALLNYSYSLCFQRFCPFPCFHLLWRNISRHLRTVPNALWDPCKIFARLLRARVGYQNLSQNKQLPAPCTTNTLKPYMTSVEDSGHSYVLGRSTEISLLCYKASALCGVPSSFSCAELFGVRIDSTTPSVAAQANL